MRRTGNPYGGAAESPPALARREGACADRCTGFPAANPDRARPISAVEATASTGKMPAAEVDSRGSLFSAS